MADPFLEFLNETFKPEINLGDDAESDPLMKCFQKVEPKFLKHATTKMNK